MITSTPLLDMSHVTAYQGDTRVFDNVSLTIPQGENVAILGPNGSGKSTLLKLLTRDIYPVAKADSYVKINGSETVNLFQLRETIGLVSHDLQSRYLAIANGLDVVLSGFFGANGMLYGHHDLTEDKIEQARAKIESFGLQGLESRMFHHLSTGQQRRFLLARALVHSPGTLVLDEPMNSLDIRSSFEWIKQLGQLAREGTTIILATHQVQDIVPEIQRIILLKNGQIVADGEKYALLNDRMLSDLYDTPVKVIEQNGFFQLLPG